MGKGLKELLQKIKPFIGGEDYLAVAIILLGFGLQLIPELTEFWSNIGIELIGIGITVLIIENANQARNQAQSIADEKKRLILQMGSPDNAFAREAVRQLRARGWLFDGTLVKKDLSGADLKGADLSDANLAGTNLKRAILKGTRLSFADLNGADVREARLEGAFLMGANLMNTILEGANLTGANLITSHLNGAYFMRANLDDAILSGANLTGVFLSGAKVSIEGLAPVLSLSGATLPDGTKLSESNWKAEFEAWCEKQKESQ